jgi:hypothetical protein
MIKPAAEELFVGSIDCVNSYIDAIESYGFFVGEEVISALAIIL